MDRNSIFRRWSYNAMGTRQGNQRTAKLLSRERSDTTLDKLWGLVPRYTGKTIRRKALANA